MYEILGGKENSRRIQWWPKNTLQVLFFETEVPTLDWMAQYKSEVTPLGTRGISIKHQNFHMRYISLL